MTPREVVARLRKVVVEAPLTANERESVLTAAQMLDLDLAALVADPDVVERAARAIVTVVRGERAYAGASPWGSATPEDLARAALTAALTPTEDT